MLQFPSLPIFLHDKGCYHARIGAGTGFNLASPYTCDALKMTKDIVSTTSRFAFADGQHEPPAIVRLAGSNARYAYNEFFAGEENSHTERAYRHAVHRFLGHCESLNIGLNDVMPGIVSDYLKHLQAEVKTPKGEPQKFREASKPMKKVHLAGIRKFFDRLVERHAIALNPAHSVRGPKHSVTEGKTPAFSVKQARHLLASIDTRTIVGLRDRAIFGVLIYTAARSGAVAKLRRRDYFMEDNQFVFRFDEKGGKVRDIPAHHDLEGFIREYLSAVGDMSPDAPLFRSALGRTKILGDNGLSQNDLLRMVKRRLYDACLQADRLTCHSFRATTITDLFEQGVHPADVQYLAGHSDARTTQLYDRRKKKVTRNIVERISI